MHDEAEPILRLSGDSALGTPDSFSDNYDEEIHKKRGRRVRPSRITRFLQSLTHEPLGVRWRRKTKSRRRRLCVCAFNFTFLVFLICVVISLLQGIFLPSYSNPPQHYKDLVRRAQSSEEPGLGNPRGEKIFIASNIIQHSLIRGAWGASLLNLIHYLGPENVFVSIYENDSGPETIAALSWLRDQLNAVKCKRKSMPVEHAAG